ncbi:beta 1-4 rhamnosyltransferase Cps2T [uncultured Fibrobacter sp.]|uniref:beta 1-4 rhamnosyltransferase Cps2T n=1 Tax=uncultured Fibrobacter sp. TaxID=261512 RepID=UPI0025CD227F|nr:glycosyltransferase family 1 protein [uncultured Fibrobacter sp.]
MADVQHVFIVGSKGIPGAYGGYETFVDKLTEYHQDDTRFKYHVACKAEENSEFEYHNARCFKVKVPKIGAAAAIAYDVLAIKQSIAYIKKNKIPHPIVYCLACRIGPFARGFQKKIHKLGGKFYVNPDGHEWLRAKWPLPVRKYWKYSEKHMVKHADLLICDSKNIEKYIQETYAKFKPQTTFIAYGAEIRRSRLADNDEKFTDWLGEKGLKPKEYYLVVGRFVPENNYETMIREFMLSKTPKNFALITNVNESFLDELKKKTGFDKDPRIKFVGTVYDQELLMKIREQAYGYFHGHEVGGTNPSLLEALASSDLNLLLDVGFNREVGEDTAIYWNKEKGNLAATIERADALPAEEIKALANASTGRIANAYSWAFISNEYAGVWTTLIE